MSLNTDAYSGTDYDFDNNIIMNWYPKRIIAQCEKTESLLELGLGHGITTNIFSEYFEDHTVLDASPAVISLFKSKYPDCKAKIIETYFEYFNTDKKFDVIVMGFVLEHVDDPIRILKHYRRFLAPTGKLFVTVPNAESLNRRIGHNAGILPDIFELSDHDRTAGHKRYYTTNTLLGATKASGYTIYENEGIYLKPLSTAQMKSLNLPQNIIDAFCIGGVAYPELCCAMLITAKKNEME